MAEQLDPKELGSFKELLMVNSIQIDAAVQLLIEKGFITEAEYLSKLKRVQGAVVPKILTVCFQVTCL